MSRLKVEPPSAIVLAGRPSPCAESRYRAARCLLGGVLPYAFPGIPVGGPSSACNLPLLSL
jgi:hypothetical protein